MSERRTYTHSEIFVLESGRELPELKIAYHTFGEWNPEKSKVVWVFHALSANSDVMEWWPGLFGEDCFFNSKEYFIVCANTIGSPYGSSKPESFDFPEFTVRDVVNAHFLLAEELGISNVHVAIGGSFGGNQALEFAHSFKGSVEHLILIASCSRESAWGIAIHEAQRLAMLADTTIGNPNGGLSGMKAARAIGMLTYRTSQLFVLQQTDDNEKQKEFKASSYINYQGEKFVNRFDALCYFYLTKCLDSHNIGRGRGGEAMALSNIKPKTLVIGIDSDVLIPTSQQKFMSENIPHAQYLEITSSYGHDGFLIETKQLTQYISNFLKQ